MKTSIALLGIALTVLVVGAGLAAAGGFGAGPAASDGRTTNDAAYGPVAVADRPLDGRGSPWATGDERLERVQERLDLTDDQLTQLRAEVAAMAQDGADRDAIRDHVRTTLANDGVDAPVSGPTGGQFADGPHGPADGAARHAPGFHGGGPYGPADGSCTN